MTDIEIAIEKLHERLERLETPGDGFGIDPIIKRGEFLMRLGEARTKAEHDEFESIRMYARAKSLHLAAYPNAYAAEESAADLAEEEARSAREREEFLACIGKGLVERLGPIAIDAFAAAVAGASKR